MLDDYLTMQLVQHGLIFPEDGDETGVRRVDCPCCDSFYDLQVDVGNTADRYQCDACDNDFVVDWVHGKVIPIPQVISSTLVGTGYSGTITCEINEDGVVDIRVQGKCKTPEAEMAFRKKVQEFTDGLMADGFTM